MTEAEALETKLASPPVPIMMEMATVYAQIAAQRMVVRTMGMIAMTVTRLSTLTLHKF